MQDRMMLWIKGKISHPEANNLSDCANTSYLALGKSESQYPYLSEEED